MTSAALTSCGNEDPAPVAESVALAATTISHGPILGQPRPDSVQLWLRTSAASSVLIEYADNSTFTGFATTVTKQTDSASDFTVKFPIGGLAANTSYWYRVKLDGVLQPGVWQFKTAPSSTAAPFSVAVLTDFHPTSAPALGAIDSLPTRPDLVVFEGDLDHSNPGDPTVVSSASQALTNMRAMHKKLRVGGTGGSNFGADFKKYFIDRPGRQLPVLHVWDDHDFGKNNSDRTFVYRPQALQAVDEYFVRASREGADPTEGIWQLQPFGAADVFILDLRSERDPNANVDANGYLKGTTTPASVLGAKQKAWLKTSLLASTKKWKIIVSPVPFNPGCKAYDSWGLFKVERQEIVDYIRNNSISGVVVVSGDIHSGGAIDDGTNSGVPEVSVPHANLKCFADTWTKFDCQPGVKTPCELGDTCGTWSGGLLCGYDSSADSGRPGYVLLTGSSTQLLIEVRSATNVVRKSLTLQ